MSVMHRKIAALLVSLMLVPSFSCYQAYAVNEEETDADINAESSVEVIEEPDATEPDADSVLEEPAFKAAADEEAAEVTEDEEAPAPLPSRDEIYSGPFPSLPSASEAIAQTAINLAWPYGTAKSVYSYSGGKATAAFRQAIDRVFPKRSSWGTQARAGASCDVFVGTVVRYSGYDSSAPRGVDPALTYYKKHPEKWTATKVCKVKDMRPGDIIVWKKSSGTKHTCIYVEINGVGYIAEAHYKSKKFGCIDKKASDYTPSKYSSFKIYRANAAYKGNLDKGYTGTNVKYLQDFLNWAGFDCGVADGVFGNKTEKAVKQFQEAAGIYVDGRFGKASLAAAKTYVPTAPPVIHVQKKKGYSGAFPKVGKKGLKYNKKKKKSPEVKKMQKFLNWYGNYKLKADGNFGKKTLKAVKSYQKKEKLKVDGIFGKACLKRAKKIRK